MKFSDAANTFMVSFGLKLLSLFSFLYTVVQILPKFASNLFLHCNKPLYVPRYLTINQVANKHSTSHTYLSFTQENMTTQPSNGQCEIKVVPMECLSI